MENEISILEKEYQSRINKTFDYIESHIEKQFTLEELASVANFSKYHFHRIFQGMVGETPFQFILRLRLEKAATALIYKPGLTITEIAYSCGFSDISIFSRNFRNHFQVSATQWRSAKSKNSNLSQTDSNKVHANDRPSVYFCRITNTLKWKTAMKLNKSVEVTVLPVMTVAYIRHTGPYKGDGKLFEKLWGRICSWAGPKGLLQLPVIKFLVIYHDDPKVTAEDKLRMSVCITVPPDTKVNDEIGKMKIEAGSYVIARFELKEDEFTEAWEWVYGQWFPASGYQPDDKPCFEIYPEEPENGRFVVDICVPVKPL
jgi:AraC family transcriptional regulator